MFINSWTGFFCQGSLDSEGKSTEITPVWVNEEFDAKFLLKRAWNDQISYPDLSRFGNVDLGMRVEILKTNSSSEH